MRHIDQIALSNTSTAAYARHLVITLISVLMFVSAGFAQLTVQYEESFSDEFPNGITDWTIDDQGNVYLIGITFIEISVPAEITLLKINREGEIEWQEDLVLPLSQPSPFYLAIDTDGNLIVAGYSYDQVFDGEHWIIAEAILSVNKYDPDGNELWGDPISHNQELTWGVYIREMVVNDAGCIYFYIDDSSNPNLALIYKISPTGLITTTNLGNAEYVKLLAIPGSVLAAAVETNEVYCQDVDYPEEDWYNVEKKTAIIDLESDPSVPWFGPLHLHSCVVDECDDHIGVPTKGWTYPQVIARCTPSGSIVISSGVKNVCPSQGNYDQYDRHFISVIDSNGVEIGSYETGGELLQVDNLDNMIVFYDDWPASSSTKITKFAPTGDFIWESAVNVGVENPLYCAVDDDNFVYCVRDGTLTCLNPDNGETEWSIYPYGGEIRIDGEKRIYLVGQYSPVTVAVYQTTKKFTILDATASHAPIAERDVELYSADTGLSGLITGHIGSYSTDANGAIEFTLSEIGELMHENVGIGLEIGDLASLAVRVTSESSPRHTTLLPTMYSVWLDPVKFNEYGIADLASIDNQSAQEYVLDHTEYRYNLLVSVEWDADEVYLQGLRSEFRYMSNFLYDVSDGQIRLDTVMIYDDGVVWDQADIRIHATNNLEPVAGVLGIRNPDKIPIKMPRKWMGGRRDRFLTHSNHPLGVVVSKNYRTMAHEFGHYALGFFDEYKFVSNYGWPEGRCTSEANYGFMDYQYTNGGEHASEMSSLYRYVDPDCRNTHQWQRNNSYPCWTMFEILNEGTFNGHYVPIKRPTHTEPEENQTPEGLDYVPGPNNTPETPDFNVGSLIEFLVPVGPPAEGVQSLHVEVPSASVGGVNVFLWQRDTDLNVTGLIDQGLTTDGGLLYVLGINTFYDMIDASGRSWQLAPTTSKGSMARSVERTWQIGDLDLNTGKSSLGMGASLSPAEDSVELILYEVDGYFPMVCGASIAGGSVTYSIQAPVQPLPSEPSVALIPSHGGVHTSAAPSVTGGYEASITDSLGNAGMIRVLAEDNSSHGFFFTSKYGLGLVNLDSVVTQIIGPDGGSELTLDTLNTGIDSVLILSSPYLVPLTGLSEDVAQGGQTHSFAVSPDVTLAGVNSIAIWYNESDLDVGNGFVGDESDLQIYRWNDLTLQWDIIGGYVDTTFNYVASSITELGTYAAFTTNIITDVEDDEHGDVLPYRFELSQNYPNPFNPVTTIEYSLPRRSSVKIDVFNLLGQKVRTLVDREESAGTYSIAWDGTTSTGEAVSTGVYFYRFQAGDHVETKKMLLLK